MMKIHLSKSANPILYRYCSFDELLSVLEEDVFHLTPTSTKLESKLAEGKWYYLSTTRTRLGKYTTGRASGVLLTLDSKRIAHNNRIIPIDYWGEDFRKHANGLYEQEDRVVSNKPTLPKATSLLLQVDILVILKNEITPNVSRSMEILGTKGISFYLYDNYKHWLVSNKKKAIQYSTLNLRKGQPQQPYFTKLYPEDVERIACLTELVEGLNPKDTVVERTANYRKLSEASQRMLLGIYRNPKEYEESLLYKMKEVAGVKPSDREPLHILIKSLVSKKLTVNMMFNALYTYWAPLFKAPY